MKTTCSIGVSLLLVVLMALGACRTALTNAPPPVTPQLATVSARSGVTVQMLEHGRTLFVSRCVECHVLPTIAEYPAERWPRIVDSMSDRANLKPAERDALVAYIVAARAQTNTGSGD